MPVIGEKIILQSTQPNFERDVVTKLSDLTNNRNSSIYDVGHIVYCKEDGRHYIFKGKNISYDNTYGYFRVFCESISDNELDNILNDLDITPVYPNPEESETDNHNISEVI